MAPLGHLGPQCRAIDFPAGAKTFTYKRAQKSTHHFGVMLFLTGIRAVVRIYTPEEAKNITLMAGWSYLVLQGPPLRWSWGWG